MKQAENVQKKPNSQFDLTTHRRDGKGKIVDENHYLLTVINGVHEYERPPGSGFIYDAAGTLIKSPKEQDQKYKNTSEVKTEFSNDALLKQIQSLQNELTKVKAAGEADDAEEISLTEAEDSGATEEASKIKAAKFNTPNFIK